MEIERGGKSASFLLVHNLIITEKNRCILYNMFIIEQGGKEDAQIKNRCYTKTKVSGYEKRHKEKQSIILAYASGNYNYAVVYVLSHVRGNYCL